MLTGASWVRSLADMLKAWICCVVFSVRQGPLSPSGCPSFRRGRWPDHPTGSSGTWCNPQTWSWWGWGGGTHLSCWQTTTHSVVWKAHQGEPLALRHSNTHLKDFQWFILLIFSVLQFFLNLNSEKICIKTVFSSKYVYSALYILKLWAEKMEVKMDQ